MEEELSLDVDADPRQTPQFDDDGDLLLPRLQPHHNRRPESNATVVLHIGNLLCLLK